MKKILIIEDEPNIRELVLYNLKANGYEGIEAEDGYMGITMVHKEKPDLIVSCGAAVAVPFFYIGKMMGAKVVYIEVFDRIDKPTMTGKMVYPIADKFVVQWDEQKKVYPKAVNLGSIF